MVWVGDLFTVPSPLDSLKLNEGVVRVRGLEPPMCLALLIKSQVRYHFATRAYYGGKPRYRPEHLGVADHCLTSWLVYHGTRGRIQTYDLPLRRRLLLFAELLGHVVGPLGFEPR